MRLSAGTLLGHYEVIAPLGAGGMGEVYRAKDPQLDREVAIKVLPASMASHPEAIERFQREAKAIAALSHPNILTIFEFGSHGRMHFAVTELLQGETLRDRLTRKGPLEPREALEIAEAVSRGLAAAHGRGIIHRDIKPENLFLTQSGDSKILDFGLARSNAIGVQPVVPDGTLPLDTQARESLDAEGYLSHATLPPEDRRPQITTPGTVLGTVGYMAPEQVRGQPASAPCDVFSLGCVVYEMISGKSPFRSATATDTIAAILKEAPPPLPKSKDAVARALEHIARRALEKDAAARYPSAVEMHDALAELKRKTFEASIARPFFRQPAFLGGVALLALLLSGLGWQVRKTQARERWAREEVLPQIMSKADDQLFSEAFALATSIESIIPNDPILAAQWPRISRDISFTSDPPGAEVFCAPYTDIEAPWQSLGTTPLEKVRLPIQHYRWKMEKAGYETALFAGAVSWLDFDEFFGEMTLEERPSDVAVGLEHRLVPEGSLPPDMISLQAGKFMMPLTGFTPSEIVEIPEFLIGRYEVTNGDYKAFVDAGGYSDPAFWKDAFIRSGESVAFSDAMSVFTDKTGRPGPSTWELGTFPDGQAGHPVGGISWYEAAAYANYREMSLPTIYQWARAAFPSMEVTDCLAASVVQLSNFSGKGTRPVGSGGDISRSGAYDMAGNVREWCLNASGDERYCLGGSWEDNPYQVSNIMSLPPWDRSPGNGLRLSRASAPIPADLLAAYDRPLPDYVAQANSISDEAFSVILRTFAYQPSPLNARVEEEVRRDDGALVRRVMIDTAYRGERMALRILVPENATPPYQSVIIFGGLDSVMRNTFGGSADFQGVPEIFLKSGRVVVWPAFAHTFERNDGEGLLALQLGGLRLSSVVVEWAMDLGRTVDYIKQEEDFDADAVAYYGLSLGGVMGSIILNGEPRVKMAILQAAGLALTSPGSAQSVPQAVFVRHLKLPVLMANGRNDYLFPYETQQIPMYELLGTPPGDKRHLVLEGGHANLPRIELVREYTAWLDRHLGPVPASNRVANRPTE